MGKISKMILDEAKKQFVDIKEFESSNLTGITYDEDEHMLYIMFKGNTLYRYDDVTHDEFMILHDAESQGKQFRSTVKNKPYMRIM